MPEYERSVFINCPFDARFEPLFHAMVLTVSACGFSPRCARESEGKAEPRIMRIARGIAGSKYSIHDLSRFQGEGADNLARFNMPLELGMALGIRFLRGLEGPREHNWLALVPENFVHQRLISDLAGYDPSCHNQTPAAVIKSVAAWLSLQPEFNPAAPVARKILEAHPRFSELLTQAKEDALGSLTWQTVLDQASVVVGEMG